MPNYHVGTVILIDIALLASYIIFSSALITYVILRDRRAEKRGWELLQIKGTLARIFLSGNVTSADSALIKKASPGEFIDVVTNRRKHAAFFNESEQQLFKEHFVTPDKINTLKSLTVRPGNKWRRIEAIVALGYSQADSAMDILEQSLRSRDEDISYFAALAIGQVNTMRSVAVLMRFLKDKPNMRRKTASILEALSPNITDEVIKFVDDPNPDIRAWAVRLLSKSVSREYISRVEELTTDPSPEVRAATCESLARLNDKASRQRLEKLLRDDVWFVRMHAVRSISSIFGKDAVPEIMRMLNDGSLSVLDSVRSAIADNIDAALPYIAGVYKGSDELAKKICAESLDAAIARMDEDGRKHMLRAAKEHYADIAAQIGGIIIKRSTEL